MLVTQIAKIVHEANRAYCETLGDDSQPVWEDAPQWQTDSAISGVLAIREGRITKPEDSHIGWLKEKEESGWIYGELKNPEDKTHPCMVPFDELPEEQQIKDHLFFAIVTLLI